MGTQRQTEAKFVAEVSWLSVVVVPDDSRTSGGWVGVKVFHDKRFV